MWRQGSVSGGFVKIRNIYLYLETSLIVSLEFQNILYKGPSPGIILFQELISLLAEQ